MERARVRTETGKSESKNQNWKGAVNERDYLPILRRLISSTAILILKKAKSIENINHKSNWRKIHIYCTTRLLCFILLKRQLCVG